MAHLHSAWRIPWTQELGIPVHGLSLRADEGLECSAMPSLLTRTVRGTDGTEGRMEASGLGRPHQAAGIPVGSMGLEEWGNLT